MVLGVTAGGTETAGLQGIRNRDWVFGGGRADHFQPGFLGGVNRAQKNKYLARKTVLVVKRTRTLRCWNIMSKGEGI